jgi:hypothetical protein
MKFEEQEILFLREHQQLLGSNNTHAAMQISLTTGMAG